jgi:hypothetical protein
VNDTLSIVLTASAWAAGGGLAVWLVTMPLRRRSIVALLASIVLAGTVWWSRSQWRSSPASPPRSRPQPPAAG